MRSLEEIQAMHTMIVKALVELEPHLTGENEGGFGSVGYMEAYRMYGVLLERIDIVEWMLDDDNKRYCATPGPHQAQQIGIYTRNFKAKYPGGRFTVRPVVDKQESKDA